MVRRVIYFAAAAAGVLAVVLPGTAMASDSAICGTTITANTTLTANAYCGSTAATAITIGKSGVTLDLGGYAVDPNASYDGIHVAPGLSNVTIENGTVNGGFDSIRDGVIGNEGQETSLVIQNLTLSAPSHRGISLHSDAGTLVTNNTITDAGIKGIESDDGAGNAFFSNTVTDSGVDNFLLADEQNSYVEGNQGEFTSGGNESTGISFYDDYSDMNLYYGNTSFGGEYGFYAYSDGEGTVTLMGNGASGTVTRDGYFVEDMYADTGVGAGPETLVEGNIATGGLASGYAGFEDEYNPGETFTQNTANRNAGDGFDIYEPWRETITNNNGSYNAYDGFLVETYGDEGTPTSFANNTAWYNQNYGFEAEGATAGSGNTGLNGSTQTNNGGDCFAMTGCS